MRRVIGAARKFHFFSALGGKGGRKRVMKLILGRGG